MYSTNNKIKLQNKTAVMEVDLHGGAITDFYLKENPVNPLPFRFSKEQMPVNNKAGAVYQGHFVCAGRWGEPSAGEINAGIPNHGEPANIEWQLKESSDNRLRMEATAHSEGLHIERQMILDEDVALCQVEETVTNINSLGRLYQLVQHPTIAAPFLNENTTINSNATSGFDYNYGDEPSKHVVKWPLVNDPNNEAFDLRKPNKDYSSVFSFVVDPNDGYGWITAYSPLHSLVLGYVWDRRDYPWINLWQHFENGSIKYRGLEFGTTGLHQPFKKIIERNNIELLGERTVAYIDAGEKATKQYMIFLHPVNKSFRGIESVLIKDGTIHVAERESTDNIKIGPFKLYNGS